MLDAQALSVLPEGPSPASRDEVFAALNFVDLPNRSVWESVVLNMLRDKFSKLVLVFTHYCKQGSDCASIQTTSRLKLGALMKFGPLQRHSPSNPQSTSMQVDSKKW